MPQSLPESDFFLSLYFSDIFQIEFQALHSGQGEGFVALDAVEYRIQQEDCVFEPDQAKPTPTTTLPTTVSTTIEATEPPDGEFRINHYPDIEAITNLVPIKISSA